ncbi:hypothetical protein BN8_01581 [Fibrisoma limi BUZ 3]|uniref:Uncharacterized protein n=1 Tax=Fibrisoma limi BUZ 3 TaxID=1185876 RepID=I2GF95_9BACT|nr:hypothetical protein BN8_01581 [Fibrisoma limi BUZ 3]
MPEQQVKPLREEDKKQNNENDNEYVVPAIGKDVRLILVVKIPDTLH